MAAPYEIWFGGNSPLGVVLSGNEYRLAEKEVRYLRTDLTCGECRHIAASLEYAPEFLWVCLEREGVLLEQSSPACMAFEERKA